MEPDEEPVYRFEVYGGIYGTPFTMTLYGPEGPRRVPEGGEATRQHTAFMSVPKGPERYALVEQAYHALKGAD